MGASVGLTGAAYANSLRGPFVFDDVTAIANNPTIRQLWPLGPAWRTHRDSTVEGRPVVNLTLALNYAWGGVDVVGYHVVNVVIHVLAALCLYGLVRRTLLLPRFRERWGSWSTGVAGVSALIWAVHPLQTESVTYIVQRCESLMGLFYLATLYCFVRGLEATGRGRTGWWLAAWLVCLLGMGSKEVMVSAPLLVLLYDLWLVGTPWREVWRQRGGWHLALFATWGLLAWLVYAAGDRGTSAGCGGSMTPWEYFQSQPVFIVRYLKLTLWPAPLVLDYGTHLFTRWNEILPPALLVIALAGGTLWSLGRHPGLAFLGTCFFATLAPTSSFIPLILQTAAEHRMYVPLAPLVVALVCGVVHICQARRRSPQNSRSAGVWQEGWVLGIISVVAIVTLSRVTYLRNQDYSSTLSIWRDTVQKNPGSARAHVGIADALVQRGEIAAAIREYDLATTLDLHFVDAYCNRGTLYSMLGEHQRALRDLNRALELKPMLTEALINRGLVHQDLGDSAAAVADFTAVLAQQPDLAMVYNNRGNAYRGQKQNALALADFDRAIALLPNRPEYYANRGATRWSLQDATGALEDLTAALRLKPDFVAVLQLRAEIYLTLQDVMRARQDIALILRLGGQLSPTLQQQWDQLSSP